MQPENAPAPAPAFAEFENLLPADAPINEPKTS